MAIGGNRPPALRRVARFGDCWHSLAISASGVAERLVALDAELAAVGRTRSEIVVSLRVDARPDATADQLISFCERYRDVGVQEIVFSLGSPELDAHRALIDLAGGGVIPTMR